MKNILFYLCLTVSINSLHAQNPKATYLFNNNGNNEVDTQHLQLNNVSFTKDFEGVSNNAALFNGTDSWAKAPKGILNSGFYEFRLSLWFKTNNNQKSGGLAFAGKETVGNYVTNYTPLLYIDSMGKLNTFMYDGGVTPIKSGATVNDNKWHHAMVVYSVNPGNGALTQSLYLDGISVASKNGTIGGVPDFSNLYIGACCARGIGDVTDKWMYFDGAIDEVNYYTDVLSYDTWSNFMFKLTSVPQSQTLNIGDSLNLSITHTDFLNESFTYLWKRGNDSVGSSKNLSIPSFSKSDTGSYTCEVTNAYSKKLVSQIAKITLTSNTAVQNVKEINPMVIYPNPGKNSINFNSSKIYTIEMYDLNGRKVLSGSTNQTLAVDELIQGIYMLKFNDGFSTFTSSWIKN